VDFAYKAFISYSHRDTRWAQWLLTALETYRLPESAARGVGKVFRDRDEAGAASDLKDEIERALAASEHLIVVASPNSARSSYVEAEIRSFAAANAHRAVPGKILTLIVAGAPHSADAAEECFPPALRGGLLKPDGAPVEPLAADARSVGDGKARALAKLVAGLMDIRYDALVRRDLLRRRRNRLLGLAASVAALAVAGAVTAVIVAQTLEQGRLRAAQEVAERDARTVAAGNDADRARRLLDGGNPGAALALAERSLPLDGSVPFIPQAYDVIYRSLYDRPQDVDVDLAGYHQAAPTVLPAGPHHYFVYNDTGTAAIWSPDAGIVYRRADLGWSQRPSLALDGSAIFATGMLALERLSLPERIWDDVNLSGVFGDLAPPEHIAAIDRTSLYACRGADIVKLTIDAQRRAGAAWRLTLPSPCTGLTVKPNGNAVAGVQTFAAEIDPAGQITQVVGPAGHTSAERLHATASSIVLSSAAGTYVYRNGSKAPLIVPKRGMDYSAFDPTGRSFIYPDIANERLVVVDLADGGTRSLPCVCLFAGYGRDGEFFTIAGREIAAYRLDTLAPTGVSHTLAAEADSFAYLAGDDMLMALRRAGPETIATLKTSGTPTTLIDGSGDPRTALLAAAFTGTHSVVTRELGPAGLSFRLLDATTIGTPPQPPATPLGRTGGIATAVPLAGGKLAMIDPAQDDGASLSVLDGDSGAVLWSKRVPVAPDLHAGDRFVGLETADGLSIYDAVTGATAPLATNLFNWSIAGDRLVGGTRAGGATTLAAYALGGGAPAALWSRPVGVGPLVLCIAPQAGLVYAMGRTANGLQFDRWQLATGAPERTLAVRESSLLTADGIAPVFDIDCDAAALRMGSVRGQQWRWDVAGGALVAEASQPVPPRSPGDAGTGVASLAAVADGRIGWDDAGAWLYDPSERRVAAVFASGGGRLSSTLYLPQSGQAVLGYESGRVEIWDVQHPSAAMIALDAHAAPVVSLDYDPQRRRLLSAGQDGTIRLWPLPSPQELLAQAGAR